MNSTAGSRDQVIYSFPNFLDSYVFQKCVQGYQIDYNDSSAKKPITGISQYDNYSVEIIQIYNVNMFKK